MATITTPLTGRRLSALRSIQAGLILSLHGDVCEKLAALPPADAPEFPTRFADYLFAARSYNAALTEFTAAYASDDSDWALELDNAHADDFEPGESVDQWHRAEPDRPPIAPVPKGRAAQ